MSGDPPMPRVVGVNYEPDGQADVHDFVADYLHDAIESGVDAEEAIRGAEEAVQEVKRRHR